MLDKLFGLIWVALTLGAFYGMVARIAARADPPANKLARGIAACGVWTLAQVAAALLVFAADYCPDCLALPGVLRQAVLDVVFILPSAAAAVRTRRLQTVTNQTRFRRDNSATTK